MSYITGLGGTPGAGWFTDNNGQPKLWVASETWSLPANAGAWNGSGGGTWEQDFDNFFSQRAAQGLTVCMTDLVGNTEQGGSYNNGNTWDNVAPFNTGQDPASGLNSTYWARYDYMLNSALAQGVTVALVFNQYDWATGCCYNGWTNAQCQAYGAALGTRYKNQPNLIWLFGNDGYPGSLDIAWDYIITGLSGAGDTHLIGVWWSAEYTSRYETDNNTAAAFGEANSAFNFGYTYNAGYWVCEYAYSETLSPDDQAHLLPVIWGDGYFYQSGATNEYYDLDDRAMRQETWWWLTAGGRGILSEAENVYPWAATSPAAVTGDWFFVHNLPVIVSTYTGLGEWWKLLPDLTSSFVTAGRGTRVSGLTSGGGGGSYENSFTNSWVTASITPDGTLAVCYLPNHTTITVSRSMLAAGWTASWIDPITGAVTPAGTSGTYNSTAKGTNSQGDPDWVLAFQGPAQLPSPAYTAFMAAM